VGLEQFDPLLIDQNAVGGHAAFDDAAGALLYVAQLFLQSVKPALRKQQRLAAMKNQQENRQIEFANVLLETKAKRVSPLPASAQPASRKPARRETSSSKCN
jgi:hypothetical protein